MKTWFTTTSLVAAIAFGGILPASARTVVHYSRHHVSSPARSPRKLYYGVGFGQQHRTTATGGNAGGYSDRN